MIRTHRARPSAASCLRRSALSAATLAALGALVAPAWGQAASSSTPSTPSAPSGGTVVITGNPLGSDRIATPAAVLSGSGLTLRRAGTLGETLEGLPGVAATGFGPNASRPIVRGLDGDRVRLLENGAASVDASSLSFDHASAIDPLVVERLEVLRGPAVLLYGGSATGGVVNAIDNRIPRSLPGATGGSGLAARAELRGGGAARERAAAAVLEGGVALGAGRGVAWHVDAFGRDAEDLRTPSFTPVEDGVALEPARRVRNSASRSEGGALGASFVTPESHAGLAAETYRHRYGVVVEPDVIIRMQRERVAASGGWKLGVPGLERVAIDASHTDYRHEEVEGSGEVGTTFKSRANDARLELRHAPVAGLRGVVGLQWEQMDFSALGEEAFVPNTRTRHQAVFVLEELALSGGVVLSGGLRAERARVASEGDAPDAAEVRFGPAAERSFSPRSAALGARVPLAPGWQLSASLARSQRAPTYYELYANGVHVATGTFELGDSALKTERSQHAELGLAWSAGAHKVELQLFRTRFSNYIALDATGTDITVPPEDPADPPEVFPEYAFKAVRARLTGFELEARTRLMAGGPVVLDAVLTLDEVRGDNLDTGEPLPRLAPRRARLGLEGAYGAAKAGVVLRQVARQTRVPATDTATPGYTMLDLWASLALPLPGEAAAYLKVGNATDKLGYNASALGNVRGLSPLAGRALSAGLRWRW